MNGPQLDVSRRLHAGNASAGGKAAGKQFIDSHSPHSLTQEPHLVPADPSFREH